MNEQELRDEIECLTDKLYFAERSRDGHYRKLQIALKRIEQLEKHQIPLTDKKPRYEDIDSL